MMTKTMRLAGLMAALLTPQAAFAQSAVPSTGTPTVETTPAKPAVGTNDPKNATVKPGQTLRNGPNAATGVSGSGNAGAGGGVSPGQQ